MAVADGGGIDDRLLQVGLPALSTTAAFDMWELRPGGLLSGPGDLLSSAAPYVLPGAELSACLLPDVAVSTERRATQLAAYLGLAGL